VSTVSVAGGHRSSQARRLSALKGLEVPLLLDRMGLLIGTKGLLGFFDIWVGVTPLLAPEGVSTMMGHSWYSLLMSRFRLMKK